MIKSSTPYLDQLNPTVNTYQYAVCKKYAFAIHTPQVEIRL